MSIQFVPFSCTVNLCEMYEVNFPPWTEATNAAICSLLRKYDSPLHALHHKSIYFFRKTKMADNHLCFFAVCYSAVAYLHKPFSLLGYSTVDPPGAWEIWLQFSNGHMRIWHTTISKSSLYILYRCSPY